MDKQLHIGIDARLWQETGVGRYIRNLIISLQDIDQENTYTLFILPSDRKAIQTFLTHKDWHLVDAPIHWHTLSEQLKFPQILNRENIDVMHFPYFSVPVRYKKPFIVTLHDIIPYHFPTGKVSTLPSILYWIKRLGYRYIVDHAVQNAAKVITVSHATEQELIRILHVPERKIIVTYEGYDKRITAKKSTSPLRASYFLYVGNAYPHKNLQRLLYAFHSMKTETKSNTKLVLVGKEDFFYRNLIPAIRKLSLTNDIIHTGYISDADLANYYDHALAVIAPSVMEGFGLPVLEAMGRGILVLASKIPAFEEICGTIATYFDPFSIESIKKTLIQVNEGKIIESRERKERGKIRAKKFSWRKMAEQTKEIYESCVSLRQS